MTDNTNIGMSAKQPLEDKDIFKDYPYTQTKTPGVTKRFNFLDAKERGEYFEAKAGKEIAEIKEYLKDNTFVVYFLGKKGAGKGTYTKIMMEIFGEDKIGHVSVGDIVRRVSAEMNDPERKDKLMEYLKNNYRGYISVDDALDSLLSRSTKTLLPTEFILTLIKREVDSMPKKSIFIDGFPREEDQVSYSLFFRNLINYRDDMDIFIAIDIPESVIDERMKNRVVCPQCQTPRSLKLLTTKKAGYDAEKKEFYLICDDEKCGGARMMGKEGDNLGIEAIRDRLELDERLIKKVFSLHGVPKILLRNTIPVELAQSHVDDYETTPEYMYALDEKGEVKVSEKPWTVKDDNGVDAYSLIAYPVAVSLIKQLHKILI